MIETVDPSGRTSWGNEGIHALSKSRINKYSNPQDTRVEMMLHITVAFARSIIWKSDAVSFACPFSFRRV